VPGAGGAHLQDAALTTIRNGLVEIILGTVFLFLGVVLCGIASLRRRSGAKILVWLGIWSGMYGMMRLLNPLAAAAQFPAWLQFYVPYVNTLNGFLILVVATRAWVELSLGKLRTFLWGVIYAGLSIAFAGMLDYFLSGGHGRFRPYNNLLATCSLTILIVVVVMPKLARRFLIIPNSRVLQAGTLIFAVEALASNVLGWAEYRIPTIWDSLGFAALLLAIAYVAVQLVFTNERRWLSMERELAIARQIQTSILPNGSPQIENLRITAAYLPMTEVAGDFYEFLPVDAYRMGVLVADVSGHGVPAALIASMLKVAVRSVVPCASDPSAVLRGLNRALSGQMPDQFVTAAYLFLDMEERRAIYSAAGHPPMLLLRDGHVEAIESNGLVFGVLSEPDYPVRVLTIHSGDRFFLYTDGVIEAENGKGQPFGNARVEQIMLESRARTADQFSQKVLGEVRGWRPNSMAQQDDITLVVVDVA